MRVLTIAFVVAALSFGLGCTTYRDQLSRGQRAFELNEHDRTLAILRDLEPDVKRLSGPEQAEYAYLRGMTDYRVGYKPDARHWLSLAKAYEDNSPGVLPADWKLRVNEALDEMNGVVYSAGIGSLATTRTEETNPSTGRTPDGSKPPTEVKSPTKDTPAPRELPKAKDEPKPDAPKPDAPKADSPAPSK
jgi:hypothetical protein